MTRTQNADHNTYQDSERPSSTATRLKWMIAAGIACSVLPQVSDGEVVQITLVDNFISESVDSLSYDLTGNGEDDLEYYGHNQFSDIDIASVSLHSIIASRGGCPLINPPPIWCESLADAYQTSNSASVTVLTTPISGYPTEDNEDAFATASGTQGASISALSEFSFTDARFGPGQIDGWLQVDASTSYSTQAGPRAQVSLSRILWDDENPTTRPEDLLAGDGAYPEAEPVPEPSSLAMLALGAVGMLARRRNRSQLQVENRPRWNVESSGDAVNEKHAPR